MRVLGSVILISVHTTGGGMVVCNVSVMCPGQFPPIVSVGNAMSPWPFPAPRCAQMRSPVDTLLRSQRTQAITCAAVNIPEGIDRDKSHPAHAGSGAAAFEAPRTVDGFQHWSEICTVRRASRGPRFAPSNLKNWCEKFVHLIEIRCSGSVHRLHPSWNF